MRSACVSSAPDNLLRLTDATLAAAVAAHGAHAPPQTPADETIQTTTNHPWLTADHGWILASFLHVGEPVQRVDGSTALVIAVRSEPGAAAMWDLTVSNVHTFAVGGGAYVVHNCGPVNDPELRGLAQKAYRQIGRASDDWKMTVAVADVQDGAGATRRLVSVNESLLGRVGREAVASSVHVVFGDSAELFTDAVDRFGFSEGYGHAEGYIKGYLESNPGSTLQRIGVSHPGGFCAACFRGLGG